MMHLEVVGEYWAGLIDEVIEHYDHAGIDKGVVLTTWTPSRESNDRTLKAYNNIPIGSFPSVMSDLKIRTGSVNLGVYLNHPSED